MKAMLERQDVHKKAQSSAPDALMLVEAGEMWMCCQSCRRSHKRVEESQKRETRVRVTYPFRSRTARQNVSSHKQTDARGDRAAAKHSATIQ